MIFLDKTPYTVDFQTPLIIMMIKNGKSFSTVAKNGYCQSVLWAGGALVM